MLASVCGFAAALEKTAVLQATIQGQHTIRKSEIVASGSTYWVHMTEVYLPHKQPVPLKQPPALY